MPDYRRARAAGAIFFFTVNTHLPFAYKRRASQRPALSNVTAPDAPQLGYRAVR
jgi:hypothetical protein